jgi:hypothetical protein
MQQFVTIFKTHGRDIPKDSNQQYASALPQSLAAHRSHHAAVEDGPGGLAERILSWLVWTMERTRRGVCRSGSRGEGTTGEDGRSYETKRLGSELHRPTFF